MTTKFARSTRPRKTPSWCKPGMYPAAQYWDAGVPAVLTGWAIWNDEDPPAPYDIAESFTLSKQDAPQGWSGASSGTGINLKVELLVAPGTDLFDVHLYIRQGETVLDDDSWHGVPIDPGPPFQTGELWHIYLPGAAFNAVSLFA